MATDPIPFPPEARADNPLDPTLGITLMGWNQLVFLKSGTNEYLEPVFTTGGGPLRVADYNIGVTQTGNAPDYITGRQDHTAWMKGPIESGGSLSYPFTFRTGKSMFIAGSNLVFNPGQSFEIFASAMPALRGCKINSVSISCNAKEEIRTEAEVWGIADTIEPEGGWPTGFPDPQLDEGGYEDLVDISSADGDEARRTTASGFGNSSGITAVGYNTLNIEQIPQWDVVQIIGAPAGMHLVGFTLRVENNLQRNYTMGDETGASPFGLNATSISASQRKVTGTISWQSNMNGTISQILGAGLESLRILIHNPSENGALEFNMVNCLWNAAPPRLSTGDRVVVESSFTALGANAEEFDALRIIDNGITIT
jgi:hypothetical protein